MKELFFLILFSILTQFSVADNFEYKVDVLSLNNGLTQHDVSSVIQDHYGFIWIATYNGLLRYDGYTFKVFKHRLDNLESISDNRIMYIYRDSANRLWIATEGGGLNLFDYTTETFKVFKLSNIPLDNNIYFIHEDDESTLWLGSNNGLYHMTFSGDEWQYTKFNSPINIHNIVDAPFGLYVGTTNGVFLMKDRNDPNAGYIPVTNIKDDYTLDALYNDGKVYFATMKGLYKIDRHQNCSVVDFPELQSGVSAITVKDKNNLIVATTNNGLFRLTTNGEQSDLEAINIEKSDILGRSILKTLFIDNQENLWIGSGTNGVYRISLAPKRFFRMFNTSMDGGAFVRAFLKDRQERMWLQTRQNSFTLYENEQAHTIDIPNEPNALVCDIAQDMNNNIWFVTAFQLFKIRPSSRTPELIANCTKDKNIMSMHSLETDIYGNIWVGCWNGILKVSSSAGYPTKFYDEKLLINRDMIGVVKLQYDPKDKILWGCSRNYGLIMAKIDDQQNISQCKLFETTGVQGEQLNSNHVWSVHRAKDGIVWVGTDTGLNKLKIENNTYTISQLKPNQQLAFDKILSIMEDRNGNIWCGTSDGLLCYNPAKDKTQQYFSDDGLSSSGMTEGMMIDNNGVIYASTINGITYFNPEDIHPNQYAPTVRITTLKIFNNEITTGKRYNGRIILKKSILDTDTISLKYNQNNFTIGFVGLHFNYPERNIYSYKLNGYDKGWTTQSNGNMQVSYNNLPAGRYVLKIKVANIDNIWSNEKSIVIEIGRAPWATWWAYSLYILFVGGFTFMITRYWSRQNKLKNRLSIETLERKHSYMLSQAREKFRANITHELRTPLTLILSPLNDLSQGLIDNSWAISRLNLIENNALRLTSLVNQFLDMEKIDNDTIPLQVQLTNIDIIISNTVDNFRHLARSKNINLSKISEQLSIPGFIDEDKVVKIMNNLLSNAFKFTPEGENISIYVSTTPDDELILEIEDTGCGISEEHLPKIFERFYQSDNRDSQGTGIGLSLVKKLIELHNGTITVTSNIGVGTKFTITIPISESDYYDKQIIKTDHPTYEYTISNGSERPIVLIVEDDVDMSNYLKDVLGLMFDVLIENNPTHAMDTALRYIPDLIITDIMMPLINGFELCGMLKNDFHTSHIPIVILTAKNEKQDYVTGYSTGAEDYLTKPFSSEQLTMKVRNIIKFRKQLSVNTPKTNDSESTSSLNEQEQKFIDRLTSLLCNNMDNPDYYIEELCQDIGTSRMQLHRKLTALTGRSTSDYIRDLKMTKAKELLETKAYNVSETIYQIGYKSNSHFSKVFKSKFGITPSDFIKRQN